MRSRRRTVDLRFCQICVLWLRRDHRIVPRLFHAVLAITLRFLVNHVAMQALVFA